MSSVAAAPLPETAETFPRFLRAIAAAHGDADAIVFEDEGGADALSFAELERRSSTLARGLLARGVGKGGRIGFVAANGPGFAMVLAAIARIGAIAVPISTLVRAGELVRVLRQSDVAGLIVQRASHGKDHVARVGDALPDLRGQAGGRLLLPEAPYLRWIVSSGEGLPPGIGDLADLERDAGAVPESVLRAVEAEVHPGDQMIEIYTSGAMALPKGVKHGHGAVLSRTHVVRRMLDVRAGERHRAILPMFWVGGLMMSLMPNLEAGATTLCSDGLLANSRFAMGSVMAEDDLAAMRGQKVIWALGMTETLGPYSYADELRAPGYPLCAPLDHIVEGFEVRVVDGAGRAVGEGGRGEIEVRGDALTPGIHKVSRAPHFTADGFYRTGDLGIVEGGRVLFVGRDGDVIKSASANVSPAEVEEELQALPGVHSAYVVGVPDRERGQLVVAAVVPREGAAIDVEALRARLRERLSSFKVPAVIVALSREEVPLLHSNKVARRRLEAMLIERLAARAGGG